MRKIDGFKIIIGFLIVILLSVGNADTVYAYENSFDNKGSDHRIVLGFAGDINLDEDWATTKFMDNRENGINDCFSPEFLELMKSYDIFMLNNEFTYSKRGEPTKGKSYTFRADPSRVQNLKKLGVDIVLMANNHVGDYGSDALLDTFDVLDSAGIPYVGAGRNISEAQAPYYMDIDGYKIAYCAASSAEAYAAKYWTPEATDSSPGILSCYDPERFLSSVREARANADYVIANLHWGLEYSNYADKFQKNLAKKTIDAGADIIIGSHPHVLQGIEIYKGKPIFYSLGNYWFNDKNLYTGLVSLTLDLPADKQKGISVKEVRFIPGVQADLFTKYVGGTKEGAEVISFVNKISYGAKLDDDGVLVIAGD